MTMVAIVTSVVALWICAVLPIPPRQTTVQKNMMSRIATQAKNASVAARPHLLQRLDSAACRKTLNDTCATRQHWNFTIAATTLLRMLHDNVAVAEIAHAFVGEKEGGFGDPSIKDLLETPELATLYPNLWQALFLNTSSRSQGQGNFSEVTLYGAPPCKTSICNWNEAANRIVYTTLGSHIDALARSGACLILHLVWYVMYSCRYVTPPSLTHPSMHAHTHKLVNPAQPWGDVTLLFKRGPSRDGNNHGGAPSLRDMVGIAPTDTGNWQGGCIGRPYPNWPPFPRHPPSPCAAAWWPPVLGTFDDFDHLLLSSVADSREGTTYIYVPCIIPSSNMI